MFRKISTYCSNYAYQRAVFLVWAILAAILSVKIGRLQFLVGIAALLFGLSLQAQSGSFLNKKGVLPSAAPSAPSQQMPAATAVRDSILGLGQKNDTIPIDTLGQGVIILPSTNEKGLNAPVQYNAVDSIVYDIKGKKIYMYNGARVAQEKMSIIASQIIFDQSAHLVEASYTSDTSGRIKGRPIFTEADRQFQSDEIVYNFDTQKGRIKQMVTKEGEGYLQGKQVKKNERNEMFIHGAHYTTCSLEHPHFKIAVDKVKVIPNDLIVSGPAQLIIEDVPTPLVVPFGIFPITKGQRSGLLLPSYGYAPSRGYFFDGMGYYFALSKYADLELRADISTNLSWRLTSTTIYRKRYRYSGSMGFAYGIINQGNKFQTDFKQNKNFSVRWSHNQDAKASRSRTFSAAVNFGSIAYNKEYSFTNNSVLTNTLSSSINYRLSPQNSPVSLTVGMRLDQNTNTSIINATLPGINVAVNRIMPFARKVPSATPKWYEKIGIAYGADAEANVSLPDTILWSENWLNRVRYGVRQTANITTDIKLLKYLNLQPRFAYNEYWYMKTTQKVWVPYYTVVDSITAEGEATSDTIPPHLETLSVNGFKRGMDFNAGINLSTRLYGTFLFKRGKLKGIRHEFSPTLGFSYRPDFAAPAWNYYKTVQKDIAGKTQQYSIFENTTYGGPSSGSQANINYGLNNILQIKVFSKKDTSAKQERKIPIFDRLYFGGNYNFLADSMRWSTVSFNGTTNIGGRLNVTFSGTLDPYAIDDNGRRVNQSQWKADKQPLRLAAFNFTLPIVLSSSKLFQKDPNENTQNTPREQEDIKNNREEFIDFNIPWNLSLDYTLSLKFTRHAGRDTTLVTQTLNLRGDVNLTQKWKVAFDSGYDFAKKAISRTTFNIYRDLHCWYFSLNISPIGDYKSYFFTIGVKASMLQDLKLIRRRYWRDL